VRAAATYTMTFRSTLARLRPVRIAALLFAFLSIPVFFIAHEIQSSMPKPEPSSGWATMVLSRKSDWPDQFRLIFDPFIALRIPGTSYIPDQNDQISTKGPRGQA
jgi:hypothetical protein